MLKLYLSYSTHGLLTQHYIDKHDKTAAFQPPLYTVMNVDYCEKCTALWDLDYQIACARFAPGPFHSRSFIWQFFPDRIVYFIRGKFRNENQRFISPNSFCRRRQIISYVSSGLHFGWSLRSLICTGFGCFTLEVRFMYTVFAHVLFAEHSWI